MGDEKLRFAQYCSEKGTSGNWQRLCPSEPLSSSLRSWEENHA
jgi:hypothetical protein